MKIIGIKQNTPEWETFRRLHIGASDAPTVCGVDPYKKAKKLWEQKFRGDKQYVTSAMRRGTELEPLARHMFEKVHQRAYPPIVTQHDDYEWMIASLDGYCMETGEGIEIKCPGEKIFNEIVLEDKIPKSYIYQMQHQMCVTGASHWLLIPFNGMYFEEIQIERDDSLIQEIIAKEEAFYQSLLSMEMPT